MNFLDAYLFLENLDNYLEETLNNLDFVSPEKLYNLPPRTAGIYLIKYHKPEEAPEYYVGKSVDIAHRTRAHFIHCPERDSKLLHAKIRAHYTNNPEYFSIAILETCSSVDELNNKERYWISKLNTYRRSNKYGLNLTRGGDGGSHFKVTIGMHDEIIYKIRTTDQTFTEIAKYYNLNLKVVRQINAGVHCLSSSDYRYPIRTAEKVGEISQSSRVEKISQASAAAHVVCLNVNKGCYYFPTTTVAAEWAVAEGLYQTALVARDRLKHKTTYDNLNAFISRCGSTNITRWGLLKEVPDQTAFDGGFAGELITNEQGKELGLKVSL